jgi:hypothetical protein
LVAINAKEEFVVLDSFFQGYNPSAGLVIALLRVQGVFAD